MSINTEAFGLQYTLPRLVDWFNGQTSADRTIPRGQLYVVKVVALLTDTGEPVFIIGTDPTVGQDSRKYLGEATYLWIGDTGIPATATSTSFFELSKTVSSEVKVITHTLTLTAPSI